MGIIKENGPAAAENSQILGKIKHKKHECGPLSLFSSFDIVTEKLDIAETILVIDIVPFVFFFLSSEMFGAKAQNTMEVS